MKNTDKLHASKNIIEEYKKTIFLYLNNNKSYLGLNVFILNVDEYRDSLIKDGYLKRYGSTYKVTPIGNKYIKDNDNYIKLYNHQNWNISLRNYENNYIEGKTFNEIAHNIFKDREKYFLETGMYTENRFNYKFISELYEEEKNKEEVIIFLFYVLIYDLCGIQVNDFMKKYKEGKIDKDKMVKYCSHSAFDIDIINKIKINKKYYRYKDLKKVYESIDLPLNMVTLSFIKKMLYELYNTEKFDYSKYTNLLQECKIDYLRML